jgi:aspartate/methionine/tyrosine aminotransferase
MGDPSLQFEKLYAISAVMSLPPHPQESFRLKPIRVARVSEISETTAAAALPPEECINFHIGNPIQDARLSSAFLRVALGLDVNQDTLCDTDPEMILEYLGWDTSNEIDLEFLIRVIQKSTPYMPRGGYSRKSPHAVVKAFCAWLEKQQEPLRYNVGDKSGRREIILASGGINEALRVMLFAISSYLEIIPARILYYRYDLPPQLRGIPNLVFDELAADERIMCEQVEQYLLSQVETPTFLLIGAVLGEETRRRLRTLTAQPLFFIEANDAPNHLSLAREAKMVQRVLRLLTPAVFTPRLKEFSTVFIIGNADFLNVIENVHFNLKGTPSASEIEFLSFLLEHKQESFRPEIPAQIPQVKPVFEGLGLGIAAESALPLLAERIEPSLERLLNDHAQVVARSLVKLNEKAESLASSIQSFWKVDDFDEFSNVEPRGLLALLVQHLHEPAWRQALQRGFLSAFVKHQPQYRSESCIVVSGSSRTALGILGFHCGLSEVVIADLSWSYEQCFPKVHAVPLTASLGLDVDAIIAKVEQLCQQDPSWPKRGAVAINNPHNATGRVFDEEAIGKLLIYCLQHDLYVIDDLAYQDVAPVDDLPQIKTLRQLASELVRLSQVDEAQADRVITVHSMSKTDCLAGARLAVVEIRGKELWQRFSAVNSHILPNLAAIFICYLFYRGTNQAVRTYWKLRNTLFRERTQALLDAVENLPPDRNPFGLVIVPPAGSMYPLLRIERLPGGLSLDWLASSLARRGIGLLPLATFARTEEGYEIGRTTFRLTLGGMDNAEVLLVKTRRLLIDLNRLVAEEEARYNRKLLPVRTMVRRVGRAEELSLLWNSLAKQILQQCENTNFFLGSAMPNPLDGEGLRSDFLQRYAPERLDVFHTRLLDRAFCSDELMRKALADGGEWLGARLEREFMKDTLNRRQEQFRLRKYDRTVHPTQMYSLQAELMFDGIINAIVSRQPVARASIESAAKELEQEYLGLNVSISSQREADEILVDLASLTVAEDFSGLFTDAALTPFLSFWSDWDGSNRPSGQGHRLAAAIVMENVHRMTHILGLLRETAPNLTIDPSLASELEMLPQRNQRFGRLLNDITLLTHQLEQRYRGILPFSMDSTRLQRLATNWRIRRDPARVLWQHNDRYERKMLDLRRQRRAMLEYYFALNKQLRKQLYASISNIQSNRSAERLLREVVNYHDILQRVVITPRIHQGMITSRDQFAIDTTVFNMYEINAIAGKYSNPGIALALQVSLASKPEPLIALDRKMRTQKEQMLREHPTVDLPAISLIPLFEDANSVENIRPYLDRIWDYAAQTRQTVQTLQERFTEIISEVFIAGSDLSQQIGQPAAASMYLQAKYNIQAWLAEHGVTEAVRTKLGSGEPMQRQGGYYSRVAGKPAFLNSDESKRRFVAHLPAVGRKSTASAVTPLQGVFMGGDLRTFQSNLAEHLRFLPARDFVGLLHHVGEAQRDHLGDLLRAAETITESRLGAHSRSLQALERLTLGTLDTVYEEFLAELTSNFRHILYGHEDDVVGIHIISYFVGRSIPQLRDRPTSRRKSSTGADRGQKILANIAEIIPLAKQGSLLRAIVHNQAQTVVLGVNQLTTGLFRAIERYIQRAFVEVEGEQIITERLLPRLPVYEILSTLRLYQDWKGEFLQAIELAFPAGNSAFMALHEDNAAMARYLPLFQQELLRRHGVNVSDFFSNNTFNPDLLPTLRPDLAVLLQENLFNTDVELMLKKVTGRVAEEWRAEVAQLLLLPQQINYWRSLIWKVIGESVYQRVQSFTELATSLYTFSSARSFAASPVIVRGARLPPAMSGFFRTAPADDEMRNFLIGAIEYLSSFAEGNIEVPVSIIRAMNDIERIAQIEESALPPAKQEAIRCCLLHIARLAGENG